MFVLKQLEKIMKDKKYIVIFEKFKISLVQFELQVIILFFFVFYFGVFFVCFFYWCVQEVIDVYGKGVF